MELGESAFLSSAQRRPFVGEARQIHTRSVLHLSPSAERTRFFGQERRDDILGSAATFMAAFAICFIALGIGAYYYAQWSL